METSIFDSDFNQEALDKLIGEKPELLVLKHVGQIDVEVDGNITTEDNRFDAPYQEGWVTGGSVDKVVSEDDFSITWYPNESDIEHIEEGSEDLDKNVLKKFKSLVLSEPRSGLSYDLTNVLKTEALERIKEEFLKHNED